MNNNDKKRRIEDIEEVISSDRKLNYLRKRLNIETMVEIMKSLASDTNDLHLDKTQILDKLFKAFDVGDTINFSALEVNDVEDILKLKPNGVITFHDKLKVEPSNHFLTTIKKLERRWNLSMENARRSLIDSYLLEAIDFDFNENNYDPLKDKLAVYPEYYIKPVHINKKLKLTGSIDYISACRREPGFGMEIKMY